MYRPNNYNSSCTDRHGNPKQSYSSEWDAEEARDHGRDSRGVDLRIYYCPNCGHYHLTSSSNRY